MSGSIAEFESSLISERTIAGMQAAKLRGKHVGRPFKLNARQIDYAQHMLSASYMTPDELADEFGCHVSTLKKALAA